MEANAAEEEPPIELEELHKTRRTSTPSTPSPSPPLSPSSPPPPTRPWHTTKVNSCAIHNLPRLTEEIPFNWILLTVLVAVCVSAFQRLRFACCRKVHRNILCHPDEEFIELELLETDFLKLMPFYLSVALYFLLVRDETIKIWSTLFKCAPIVCLMIYVLLNAGQGLLKFKYSQRILLGLLWSCIGDALLNYDLFPHGMGAFGVAQICYIFAFRWRPLKLTIGIPLYFADFILTLTMLDVLSDVLLFGIPMYVTLLLTMCWRSLARASVGENPVHIVCGLGSVMFVISDALIAANMFLGEIPFARLLVMSTYYLAQFCITLSTSEECKLPAILAKWIREDTSSHTHAQ